MIKDIKLKERHLYGRIVYYPCDQSGENLLKLSGMHHRKCFSEDQLKALSDLGYKIEILRWTKD